MRAGRVSEGMAVCKVWAESAVYDFARRQPNRTPSKASAHMQRLYRWILPTLLLFVFTTPRVGSAQTCSQPLRVSYVTVPSSFTNESFSVSDPNACGWQAVPELSNSSWVSVTAGFSGAGSGTVRFNVLPYAGSSFRATVLRAGNEFLVIRQNSPGLVSGVAVNPATLFVPDAGGTATAAVAATAGTAWQSSAALAPFTTLTNGFSGNGNGTVALTVRANVLAPRVGLLMVGSALVAIVQKGPSSLTCDTSLLSAAPLRVAFPSSGGTQSVQLSAPAICSVVATTSAGWLTVSPSQSLGSATFVLQAASNTSAPRAATARLGNLVVDVSQSGQTAPGCLRSVSPTTIDATRDGGTFPVNVTSVNCAAWSVTTPAGVSASPRSGTGSQQVRLSVGANSGAARSFTIVVAGASVALRQAGANTCPRPLVSPSSASVPSAGGLINIAVQAGPSCPWAVVGAPSDVGVQNASGTGPGQVTLQVPASYTSSPRVFTTSIAGVPVQITQAALVCGYVVRTPTQAVAREGGTFSTEVVAPGGCSPASVTVPSWMAIQSRADTPGSGTIAFNVTANPNPGSRNGIVRIGDSSMSVSQAGAPPNGTTFDGSNRAIPWVHEPSTAVWRGADGAIRQLGVASDMPIVADPDGDGRWDILVWRPLPGTSVFYLMPSSGVCPALYEYEGVTGDGNLVCRRFFGRQGDIPLRFAGDKDIFDDLAVYRVSTNTLYLTTSSGVCPTTIPAAAVGFDGRWICAVSFGLPGDQILAADVSGDGQSDLVAWRPSSGYFHILPSDGICPLGGCQVQWGLSGDRPLLARFIEPDRASVAVFRPSEGNWYLASFSGACPTSFRTLGPVHGGITACVRSFGWGSDTLVHQDYEGDGIDDIAVFRPTSRDWFVIPSSGSCPAGVPQAFVNSDGSAACKATWGSPGSTPLTGIR